MPQLIWGSTLVIANPTSHSGKGLQGAQDAHEFLDGHTQLVPEYELRYTKAAGEAISIAADAVGYDSVVALGGDGIIHEVVNGLMRIPHADRPRLVVVPYGSGNDFARTLGLPLNNAQKSLSAIEDGVLRTIDLGLATSDERPEGEYFTETLSFGVDAAIALDTTERRAQGTKQQGSGLFLTSSYKLMAQVKEGWPCRVSFDGNKVQDLDIVIFTIQNGPTYGGGFRICPHARPTDGLFDICHNVKKPPVPILLALMSLARFGRHTSFSAVEMSRATSVSIEFGEKVAPCQIDGELLPGSRFEIQIKPRELEVVVPPTCRW